jgi:CheY-like chemotaxis protein
LTVSLPDEPLWLEGDPVRLAQIFSNLLNNAAKYTPRGGAIGVAVRRHAQRVVISVTDNGAGIAPERLPRIFDLFNRGGRGPDEPGLGIGLALSRRLVDMHGGTMEVHSEGIGLGSEFTVRLPVRENPQSPMAAEEVTGPARLQKRILLVDDNREAAESLGMLLRFLGADVRIAYTGQDALAAYADYRPAFVLLDIGMPGMDGYEVARRLRAQESGRRAVLIALTGWGQEEDRRRARDAGFDHHLIKPADISTLEQLFNSLPASAARPA